MKSTTYEKSAIRLNCQNSKPRGSKKRFNDKNFKLTPNTNRYKKIPRNKQEETK